MRVWYNVLKQKVEIRRIISWGGIDATLPNCYSKINLMNLIKTTKDRIVKAALGKGTVPSGLVELNKYFRQFGQINFQEHKEDGVIISVSTNFKYGSIIAHGKNRKELDANVEDAILTSFEVPSSYKKEASLIKVGKKQDAYVLA